MACGWHRGYFGMQFNSPDERRISQVWDSGQEAIDRDKCPLTTASRWWARAKGWLQAISATRELAAIAIGFTRGRQASSSGSSSQQSRTARSHTIYSGYYFHPEDRDEADLQLRAPKEGATCAASTASARTSAAQTDICCAKRSMATNGSALPRANGSS